MSPEIRSQVQGLSLALCTALGCVAYEKIVKVSRFSTILFLAVVFYLPALGFFVLRDGAATIKEIQRVCSTPTLRGWALVYLLTWVTIPLWFSITKHQSVLAGSLYEVKYIAVLAIFYVLIGEHRLTLNLAIACVCALASVYFVSRT